MYNFSADPNVHVTSASKHYNCGKNHQTTGIQSVNSLTDTDDDSEDEFSSFESENSDPSSSDDQEMFENDEDGGDNESDTDSVINMIEQNCSYVEDGNNINYTKDRVKFDKFIKFNGLCSTERKGSNCLETESVIEYGTTDKFDDFVHKNDEAVKVEAEKLETENDCFAALHYSETEQISDIINNENELHCPLKRSSCTKFDVNERNGKVVNTQSDMLEFKGFLLNQLADCVDGLDNGISGHGQDELFGATYKKEQTICELEVPYKNEDLETEKCIKDNVTDSIEDQTSPSKGGVTGSKLDTQQCCVKVDTLQKLPNEEDTFESLQNAEIGVRTDCSYGKAGWEIERPSNKTSDSICTTSDVERQLVGSSYSDIALGLFECSQLIDQKGGNSLGMQRHIEPQMGSFEMQRNNKLQITDDEKDNHVNSLLKNEENLLYAEVADKYLPRNQFATCSELLNLAEDKKLESKARKDPDCKLSGNKCPKGFNNSANQQEKADHKSKKKLALKQENGTILKHTKGTEKCVGKSIGKRERRQNEVEEDFVNAGNMLSHLNAKFEDIKKCINLEVQADTVNSELNKPSDFSLSGELGEEKKNTSVESLSTELERFKQTDQGLSFKMQELMGDSLENSSSTGDASKMEDNFDTFEKAFTKSEKPRSKTIGTKGNVRHTIKKSEKFSETETCSAKRKKLFSCDNKSDSLKNQRRESSTFSRKIENGKITADTDVYAFSFDDDKEDLSLDSFHQNVLKKRKMSWNDKGNNRMLHGKKMERLSKLKVHEVKDLPDNTTKINDNLTADNKYKLSESHLVNLNSASNHYISERPPYGRYFSEPGFPLVEKFEHFEKQHATGTNTVTNRNLLFKNEIGHSEESVNSCMDLAFSDCQQDEMKCDSEKKLKVREPCATDWKCAKKQNPINGESTDYSLTGRHMLTDTCLPEENPSVLGKVIKKPRNTDQNDNRTSGISNTSSEAENSNLLVSNVKWVTDFENTSNDKEEIAVLESKGTSSKEEQAIGNASNSLLSNRNLNPGKYQSKFSKNFMCTVHTNFEKTFKPIENKTVPIFVHHVKPLHERQEIKFAFGRYRKKVSNAPVNNVPAVFENQMRSTERRSRIKSKDLSSEKMEQNQKTKSETEHHLKTRKTKAKTCTSTGVELKGNQDISVEKDDNKCTKVKTANLTASSNQNFWNTSGGNFSDSSVGVGEGHILKGENTEKQGNTKRMMDIDFENNAVNISVVNDSVEDVQDLTNTMEQNTMFGSGHKNDCDNRSEVGLKPFEDENKSCEKKNGITTFKQNMETTKAGNTCVDFEWNFEPTVHNISVFRVPPLQGSNEHRCSNKLDRNGISSDNDQIVFDEIKDPANDKVENMDESETKYGVIPRVTGQNGFDACSPISKNEMNELNFNDNSKKNQNIDDNMTKVKEGNTLVKNTDFKIEEVDFEEQDTENHAWNETLKSFILQNLDTEEKASTLELKSKPDVNVESLLEQKIAEQYLYRSIETIKRQQSENGTENFLPDNGRNEDDIEMNGKNEDDIGMNTDILLTSQDLENHFETFENNVSSVDLDIHTPVSEMEPLFKSSVNSSSLL